MAIVSHGYGEQDIDEAEWARLASMLGSPYGYSHPGAVAPYVASGLTLGFQNGSTSGWGVLDDFTGHTIQMPATAGWWCVVLRRSWGALGRKSEVVPLQTSGVGVPPSRRSLPGTQDDQPIAFAQTSASAITAMLDARQLASKNFWVRDVRAVHDPQIGATYTLPDGTRYITSLSSAGTVALRKEETVPSSDTGSGSGSGTSGALPIRWGYGPQYFDAQGIASIRHNLGVVPDMVMVQPALGAASAPVVISPADPAHVPEALTQTTFKAIARRADTGAVVTAINRVQWVAYGRSA